MAGHAEEGSRVEAAQGLSRGPLDWINAFFKVGLPIVLPIITVYAGCVATSIQNRISGATLLSQREQAESQLRATMFSSLIEPMAGPKKEAQIPLDRERLLIELLALNFHEHFELKPLFERVDQRLESEGAKEMGDRRVRQARESLRSVARRIIDRQIALFPKEGAGNESTNPESGLFNRLTGTVLKRRTKNKADQAKVYSLVVVERRDNLNADEQDYLNGLRQDGNEPYEINQPIPDLTSPGSNPTHRFTMVVSEPKWKQHQFSATLYACPPKPNDCRPQSGNPIKLLDISPTWADLPLTDNTLLPDGNRFSLVVYKVADRSPEVPLRTAWLKFIWFPRNYITPRERPIDYNEVLTLVGKQAE